MDGPLLLTASRFNGLVRFGTRPVLDLWNRTTPLWNASPTGQVMVLNLVRPGRVARRPRNTCLAPRLTCPSAVHALTQAIQAPAWPLPNAMSSNVTSALPLAALVSDTTSAPASPTPAGQRLGALVELFNVTLTVPLLDYLALVTLATESNASAVASVRACMDASVLSQAALLAPGIQVCMRS